jgi:hypothetical protein
MQAAAIFLPVRWVMLVESGVVRWKSGVED